MDVPMPRWLAQLYALWVMTAAVEAMSRPTTIAEFDRVMERTRSAMRTLANAEDEPVPAVFADI